MSAEGERKRREEVNELKVNIKIENEPKMKKKEHPRSEFTHFAGEKRK